MIVERNCFPFIVILPRYDLPAPLCLLYLSPVRPNILEGLQWKENNYVLQSEEEGQLE